MNATKSFFEVLCKTNHNYARQKIGSMGRRRLERSGLECLDRMRQFDM